MQFTPDMLLKQLFYDLDALELSEEWEKQKEYKQQFKVIRVPELEEYHSYLTSDKTTFNVT